MKTPHRRATLRDLMLAAATLAAVTLATPRAGYAEVQCTRSAERQALSEFGRARELAGARELAQARAAYERSLSLCPRVPAAFNLARVLQQVGDKLEARTRFQELLSEAYGVLEAETREVVVAALEDLRNEIASLEVTAVGADPIVLTVDGAQVAALREGRPHTIEINPGRRLIRGTADDGRVVEVVRDVASGAREAVRLELPLPPALGRLVVTADDDEATVQIVGVGEAVGRLSRQLSPDSYTVQLADEGDTQTVSVLAGETTRVFLDGSTVFESPLFWIITGLTVVAAGVTAGLLLAMSDDDTAVSDPVWGRVFLLRRE